MISKSLLAKFLNPWVWNAGLILVFTASAWGVEEGLIASRLQKEGEWNLRANELWRRADALPSLFPDLELLRGRLKTQQKELDRRQKETASFDKKVLKTAALEELLKGKGGNEGLWRVNRLGPCEGALSGKPYLCDTFEVVGERDLGTLAPYLDSLEKSSPLVKVVALEVAPRGGGFGRPEVKIQVEAVHSAQKSF